MSRKRYFGISVNRHRLPVQWKRFSIRFLLVLTAAFALGLGYWKAASYRHPAHANLDYHNADFTSGRSITLGPNEVSIRSIARNRYDGSIDVLKGSGLTTSIPNANVLKNCCKWLDVVQLEIGPGREYFEIAEIRVFHHDTRTIFQKREGLGWQFIPPNVIQVHGIGTEVPEQFDLWIRGRSYPGDEMAILEPKIGAQAHIDGGTIELIDFTENYAGWDETHGFVSDLPDSFTQPPPAIRLAWEGDRPREDFREINVVTKDGRIQFSHETFNLRVPSRKFEPFIFPESWHAIDHFEIRPKTKERAFFFDGLKVPPLPPTARPFDPLPSITRTADQLRTGTQLVEYAPLDIYAKAFRGRETWLEYTDRFDAYRLASKPPENQEIGFTFGLWKSGSFYLPMDIHWKDSRSQSWRLNQHGGLITSTGRNVLTSFHYQEQLEEIEAVKFVPHSR